MIKMGVLNFEKKPNVVAYPDHPKGKVNAIREEKKETIQGFSIYMVEKEGLEKEMVSSSIRQCLPRFELKNWNVEDLPLIYKPIII